MAGEEDRRGVFKRFAEAVAYVSGDFGDAATYERVKQALGEPAATRPSTWRSHRRCSGGWSRGCTPPGCVSAASASSSRSPSATTLRPPARWPRSCTSTSTSHSSTGSTTSSARWGCRRSSTCASRTRRSSPSGIATTSPPYRSRWPSGRRRGPRALLRPGRRPARRGRQPPAAGGRRGAMEPPAGGDADTLKDAKYAVLRSMQTPTRRVTYAASTTATADPGVAPDSKTETYAALGSRSTTGAGRVFRSSSAPASGCPLKQTEVRLVFKHPPKLAFIPTGSRRPEPSQIVIKIDPGTGVQMVLDALRADRQGDRRHPPRHGVRAGGRRGCPPRTRCCCTPRWSATPRRFTRQDSVEESWRVLAPLLDSPPKVSPTPRARGARSGREADHRLRRLARALARPAPRPGQQTE